MLDVESFVPTMKESERLKKTYTYLKVYNSVIKLLAKSINKINLKSKIQDLKKKQSL